ncbi:MAG: TonB-dependent receptor domain-containing protein [Bryobacteraceae bacterium]
MWSFCGLLIVSFLLIVPSLIEAKSPPRGAEQSTQAPATTPPPAPDATPATHTAPLNGARPRLGSAAQRNENVAVYQIDNNAIREANSRLGTLPTIIPEPSAEVGYFATEHGRPIGESVFLRPATITPSWHGELFWLHRNSVFNARTFFQVGPVLPSRRNEYGSRFTGLVPKLGFLTGSFSQRKVRGMVNGNVLVPLPEERVPAATDPRVRAIVSRFLAAYPERLPNRTDFDPRALNTNAPQNNDDTDGSLRLDRDVTSRSRLSLFQSILRQRIRAFQFVAGQNPDTDLHSSRSRITYHLTLSPLTEVDLGAGFQRTMSLLIPEPNAVGPRVRFGYQIQELGPDSQFPIDRAQNAFYYGAGVSRRTAGGGHTFHVGGDVRRLQINGIETNNQRGLLIFSNNFGRTAIENLLMGTPSLYEVTVGELARGYRNWSANTYFADRWRVNSRLLIYYGLRYSSETAPTEVNNFETIPYSCDCNNFSPRFSLAYQLGRGWVTRAAYTISYGGIPPVTYQQIRNNLPHVRYLVVQNPDLLNPMITTGAGRVSERNSPTILSPDLISPYSHQYNFNLERRIADRYLFRAGYLGSRTIKLLNAYITNRARPVPGIPLTTGTVDQRRPDPHFTDIKNVINAGIAYFDAAQAAFDMPLSRGLTFTTRYTFSKAIDQGADFSGTAANRDLLNGRSQSEYDLLSDRKGLSNFDSTHFFSFTWNYEIPSLFHGKGWGDRLLGGWQVSGAALLKSGTPFTIYVGSDAPGFGNVDGSSSDRPNVIDPSVLGKTIPHPDVSTRIMRPDRFSFITPGDHRGSVARNAFRKADIRNLNAALTKQWRWGGGREWGALFRAEAYNLTNTPQFDEPQRQLSAPSFGRITNTLNDGRVLQIGLRLYL